MAMVPFSDLRFYITNQRCEKHRVCFNMDVSIDILRNDSSVYTSCYCEENVYNLCKKLSESSTSTSPPAAFAVFISNASKTVAVWNQRASRRPEEPVVWDYHVILVVCAASGAVVYDLDSTLPFPTALDEYVHAAFQQQHCIAAQYKAAFRAVPFQDYLAWFSSDRRHMRGEHGGWSMPPPVYPCMCGDRASAAGQPHTLAAFWDVSTSSPQTVPGRLCSDTAELLRFFDSACQA